MGMSNTLVHALLNAIFNSTAYSVAADPYISLHTGNPGTTGANEVTGGSYVRKQVAFNAAASRTAKNTSSVTWLSMPAATVTYVGVYDALAGNFLWGGELDESISVSVGQSLTLSAEKIIAALDS